MFLLEIVKPFAERQQMPWGRGWLIHFSATPCICFSFPQIDDYIKDGLSVQTNNPSVARFYTVKFDR